MNLKTTSMLATAALLALGTVQSAWAQSGTVKVAWIDPLSGQMAPLGQNQLRSWQFAAEMANERKLAGDAKFEIVPFEGSIQWPWLEFGQPGVTKMLYGFDIVGEGAVSVSFGIDQSNGGKVVIFGGGIPVSMGGQIVGAVGTSAGTVEQDIAVAEAAIAALDAD